MSFDSSKQYPLVKHRMRAELEIDDIVIVQNIRHDNKELLLEPYDVTGYEPLADPKKSKMS